MKSPLNILLEIPATDIHKTAVLRTTFKGNVDGKNKSDILTLSRNLEEEMAMRITWTTETGGRRSMLLMIALLIFFTLPLPAASAASQEEKKGVSIGKATGIGALLGLGLGQSLGGVISGAAIGAAGGMIANEVIRQKDNKQAPPPRAASPPAKPEPPEEMAQKDFDAEIEKAIGRDNYEGYKALRACEFERASGLAKVGAISKNEEFRLVSLWLEAMISVEARDGQSQELFEQLVQRDPDIDTIQQAKHRDRQGGARPPE